MMPLMGNYTAIVTREAGRNSWLLRILTENKNQQVAKLCLTTRGKWRQQQGPANAWGNLTRWATTQRPSAQDSSAQVEPRQQEPRGQYKTKSPSPPSPGEHGNSPSPLDACLRKEEDNETPWNGKHSPEQSLELTEYLHKTNYDKPEKKWQI